MVSSPDPNSACTVDERLAHLAGLSLADDFVSPYEAENMADVKLVAPNLESFPTTEDKCSSMISKDSNYDTTVATQALIQVGTASAAASQTSELGGMKQEVYELKRQLARETKEKEAWKVRWAGLSHHWLAGLASMIHMGIITEGDELPTMLTCDVPSYVELELLTNEAMPTYPYWLRNVPHHDTLFPLYNGLDAAEPLIITTEDQGPAEIDPADDEYHTCGHQVPPKPSTKVQ